MPRRTASRSSTTTGSPSAPAGTADYVSFNNVHVGQLIGSGFVQCVNAWHVAKPNVVVMAGRSRTDNNATLFAQGYNGASRPTSSPESTRRRPPRGDMDAACPL